jgi:hypothetical protein
MRSAFAALLFLTFLAASSSANAANDGVWRITKTEWTQADEKGFGDFVRAIAESGCQTTIECMHSRANPYYSADEAHLPFDADCAKWVYMLRAYYAWKNGLPFGYVNEISGSGSDIRFNDSGNTVLSRHDFVDHGNGLPALAILSEIHDHVFSATYRVDATKPGALSSDFYSPKIQPGSIRPGTVIYDINGHVTIVYAIEPDGRVHYMSADPDTTVTRAFYGAQFGQSQASLGGGFKNFRPLKLVGATRRADGSYEGGHIVLAADSDIPDYSLEQYRGTGADAHGDGPDALFSYRDSQVGLFEYVRGEMSGGSYTLDPVSELKTGMDTLCHALRERGQAVDEAIRQGIDKKPHPAALPGNIYASDDDEWEAYATPARDATLRDSFAQLYVDVVKSVFRAQKRGDDYAAQYAAETALKDKLQNAYGQAEQSCSLTYTNSAGRPVTLTFKQALDRLFAMSFDPYDCIERRWGATSDEELSSCQDDQTKTRWYEAEQDLRNQSERSASSKPHLTLTELERGVPGAGAKTPAPIDIGAMLGDIGRKPLMASMSPVGF